MTAYPDLQTPLPSSGLVDGASGYWGGPPAGVPERVHAALAAIAAGRPVVVVDDGRENESDLVFAAEHATADLVAFALRHTSGFLCVAVTPTET